MGKLCTAGDWSQRTITALCVHYELLSSIMVLRKPNSRVDFCFLQAAWNLWDSRMSWSHRSAHHVMTEESTVLCNCACHFKTKRRLLMFRLDLFWICSDSGGKNKSPTSTAIGLALHAIFRKEAEGWKRKEIPRVFSKTQWGELIMA